MLGDSDNKKQRISPRHIQLAVRNDEDDSLFQVDSLSSQLISRCGECRSKILSSVVGKELII